MTHSYISTRTCTYTCNKYRPVISLFWPDYYTCLMLCWCFGNTSLFCWFQGRNLLEDDQHLKIGSDILKKEKQISRRRVFSPFLSIKNIVIFCFCFSRYLASYYNKIEIPRIKFNGCLHKGLHNLLRFGYYDLDT